MMLQILSITKQVSLSLVKAGLSVLALTALFQANAMANESSVENSDGSFFNPIYENGADPWLEYFNGNYYLTTTTWTSQLVMRKAPTLAGLADAEPVYLWSEVDPKRCCNFWAYEFHRLKGPDGYRWYLMFTSGKQENLDGQHLTVLESVGDDPMGPYEFKGSPMPNSWNIDGNYMTVDDQLYLLWSEWVGDEQLNWIAKMSNPWTITGKREVLTRPTYEWEKSGRKVNEGAEALQRNGRTFVVYSGSFCDTPDYKLGMIELTGDDPMNPDHWTKYDEPVFERNNGVYGPGHNGFFKSPDGTEDWLIYHGNDSPDKGCSATRSLRAQPFNWNDDGTPNFGEPASETTRIKAPSGENGPMTVVPEGMPLQLRNSEGECLSASRAFATCSEQTRWVIDPIGDNQFRLANPQGQFLTAADCEGDNQPWRNQSCQHWAVTTHDDGSMDLVADSATNDSCKGATCGLQLHAEQPLAIVSRQSGRVLTTNNANLVEQHAWQPEKSQQTWMLEAASEGGVMLKQGDQCLVVTNRSLGAGAPLTVGQCNGAESRWYLQPQSSGAYEFKSAHSGLVMDLASCGLADATPINQAPSEDSLCQEFFLREVQ